MAVNHCFRLEALLTHPRVSRVVVCGVARIEALDNTTNILPLLAASRCLSKAEYYPRNKTVLLPLLVTIRYIIQLISLHFLLPFI